MAAPSRRTADSVKQALFSRSYQFDFFQAVRLLGWVFPGRSGVGGKAKPHEEVARFGARLSLAFPPSAIHDIEWTPDTPAPARVIVAFMALTGTQGVLPFHYTERMIARKAVKDHTLSAFLDLFNHRMVSLFYRAWEKYHRAALYEAAVLHGERPDAFTHSLFDLIGMGTEGLRGRMRIHDESLLLYAGLVAQRPHSASALRGILRDYFGMPVEIEQCLGNWHTLEPEDRCYLSPEQERNQLGEGAILGEEVWDQQARFRIRAGPLEFLRFLDFLPGAPGLTKLLELTEFLTGRAAAFDVQVVLRKREVPYCRLDDEGLDAPRLGYMGWLKTEDFICDAHDAVFASVN
jgi:type VI secretion system protein ImpH